MTERVMDTQQELIKRLENLYTKFKKESIERRTAERKQKYELERAALWDNIEKNHKILIDAGAPAEYEEKFKAASVLNGKFYERQKGWVPTKKPDPTLPPETSAKAITTEQPKREENASTSATTQEGYNDSDDSDSDGGLNYHDSNSKIGGAGFYESKASDPKSPKTELSSKIPKVPQSSQLSSNQMVDQGNTPGIQQILYMLAQNQIQQNQMKLPEVKLKTFYGDILQYRAFKRQFARTVHNTKWSQVELLLFLRSYLEGEAYEAIEKFDLTDASYPLAWALLDEYYDHPRKILQATMQLLQDPKLQTRAGDVSSYSSFVNTYSTMLANIKQLAATSEDILIELVLRNIDNETRGRFEDFIGMQKTPPSFSQLTSFFTKEKIVCENKPRIQLTNSAPQSKEKPSHSKSSKSFATEDKTTKERECYICKKSHIVIDCDVFLASKNRESLLRQHKICIFCTKHRYDRNHRCRSLNYLSCEKCKGKHITLMHPLENESASQTATTLLTQEVSDKISLLPTAIANILDVNDNPSPVRCLVDLCAESSYVCEDLVQKLRLKKFKTKVTISGVNGISEKASSYVKLVIKLDNPNIENIVTNALVVPKVTGILPSKTAPEHLIQIKHKLADPTFFKPSFVGVLLGCDVSAKLFKQGEPLEVTTDGLLLQPTHLGLIVSGGATKSSQVVSTFITLNESFTKATQDEDMARKILDFYELPEPEETNADQEEYCEVLFREKHYRLEDGRYVVPTPWKVDGPILGHSYRTAMQMFRGQEGKWLKNSNHHQMSNKFMTDYENLGHMTRIEKQNEKDDGNAVYYIPYLSVLRENSLTTKLRNVFNASMKTSNGVSLNDTMLEGPKLQTSIKDIIIKARSFKFVYSADISMMFRQIQILPEDRDKHRIIWRPSNDIPPQEYRLNTVTYGTDSAPFLAIRTIHQCAEDNATPEIAEIIKKSFYVDDLFHVADTIELAQRQIEEIKKALSAGQLPLTKWMSNSDEVLRKVPIEERVSSFITKECRSNSEVNKELKVLGVPYDYNQDDFILNFKQPESVKFTKRGISSSSATFYDPLGFILPFVMMLRIFLQKVWKQKVDWDDRLAESFQNEFTNCIKGVNKLNSIRIPRYIPANEDNIVEFIGFSDASSHAQAAVIYSRVKTENGYKVTLLTSKGNVSKLKTAAVLESKQCTIPKLEFEAMVTLSELFKGVKECFKHRTIKFTAYTDSKVVLAWIRNASKTNQKFVERRVTKIRSVINPKDVHYVKSEENPADPASRGLTADQLSSNTLWFLGPAWLQNDDLPNTPWSENTHAFTTISDEKEDLFAKFSS